MFKRIIAIIALLTLPAQGQICSEYYEKLGYHNFVRQEFSSGSCSLGVTPDNAWQSLIYRAFGFSDDGMLMVFNSFSKNEGPESTGARVYYFFPRALTPDIQKISHEITRVTSASPGLNFDFSNTTGKLVAFSWGQFQEAAAIDRQNQGGLELLNQGGLMLDSGFAFDQDPRALAKNKSVFLDARGQKCPVKNTDIYEYLPGGDVRFRLTDAELSQFIKKMCPNLKSEF